MSADITLMNAALRVLTSYREQTVPDPDDVQLLLSTTKDPAMARNLDLVAWRIVSDGLAALQTRRGGPQ